MEMAKSALVAQSPRGKTPNTILARLLLALQEHSKYMRVVCIELCRAKPSQSMFDYGRRTARLGDGVSGRTLQAYQANWPWSDVYGPPSHCTSERAALGSTNV